MNDHKQWPLISSFDWEELFRFHHDQGFKKRRAEDGYAAGESQTGVWEARSQGVYVWHSFVLQGFGDVYVSLRYLYSFIYFIVHT